MKNETLLDTHLLLWAAGQPSRLSRAAHKLMSDSRNELIFSAATLWENAIVLAYCVEASARTTRRARTGFRLI